MVRFPYCIILNIVMLENKIYEMPTTTKNHLCLSVSQSVILDVLSLPLLRNKDANIAFVVDEVDNFMSAGGMR